MGKYNYMNLNQKMIRIRKESAEADPQTVQ